MFCVRVYVSGSRRIHVRVVLGKSSGMQFRSIKWEISRILIFHCGTYQFRIYCCKWDICTDNILLPIPLNLELNSLVFHKLFLSHLALVNEGRYSYELRASLVGEGYQRYFHPKLHHFPCLLLNCRKVSRASIWSFRRHDGDRFCSSAAVYRKTVIRCSATIPVRWTRRDPNALFPRPIVPRIINQSRLAGICRLTETIFLNHGESCTGVASVFEISGIQAPYTSEIGQTVVKTRDRERGEGEGVRRRRREREREKDTLARYEKVERVGAQSGHNRRLEETVTSGPWDVAVINVVSRIGRSSVPRRARLAFAVSAALSHGENFQGREISRNPIIVRC